MQNHDPAATERLRAIGGQGLVEQIVGLFLSHTPRRLQAIREGIERGEWPNAEREAHSMKSAAGNLGLENIQDLSARLEDACEKRHSGVAQALLGELETTWDIMKSKVEQLLLPPP